MSQPTSTTPLLTAHPNLSEFTERDLKDILTDPTLTRAVLSSLEPVRTAMDEQAKLSRGNEDLARKNLELQDELIQLRSSTASAYSTAQHMKQRWIELEAQQNAMYQKYRPSFLHLRLKHSVTDQEEKTERLASSFIDCEDPNQTVDTFVKQFRAERKEYHKRSYWCEKWSKGEVAWRED